MTKEFNLQFTPLRIDDLDTLYQWFQKPQIKEWYAKHIDFSKKDIFKKYAPRIHGEEKIPSYIMTLGDHKIGFIQYFCLKSFLPEGILDHTHPLFKNNAPSQCAGLDLFIGEGSYLGKGIGTLVIKQFINEIVPDKYEIIVVDPDLENKRAIQCYLKSGFIKFSVEHSNQYDESIQIMIYTRANKKYLQSN